MNATTIPWVAIPVGGGAGGRAFEKLRGKTAREEGWRNVEEAVSNKMIQQETFTSDYFIYVVSAVSRRGKRHPLKEYYVAVATPRCGGERK